MTSLENIVGKKFGRWLCLHPTDKIPKQDRKFICVCECGTFKLVVGYSLTSGLSKSCGCLRREKSAFNKRTHGLCKTKEHNSWRGMKSRCDNPKDTHYQFYGERGITYDKSWSDFEVFLSDMGNCPDNFQLDRIDVNKNYSKENCRWADLTQQAYNIRKKRNNTSGRTGVYYNKQYGTYYAIITIYKVVIHLGSYKTFDEACDARMLAEIMYYGKEKE